MMDKIAHKIWWMALILFAVYALTAPQNHSEAEDVYHFAKVVEQGSFSEQAGVNRVLALPMFGTFYRLAQEVGYSGRAFPFMIFVNRLLAVSTLLLFWSLLQGLNPNAQRLAPVVFFLAFSYGFWRYANEAETYMLAAVFVLGAWWLVARGKWLLAIACSAVGILVHLLNLIPLLLIIPLYYLLSKDWKKGVLHGVVTGLLVLLGYAICFQVLDWGELGAQHHAEEGGFCFTNFVRAGIAFGQCVVSGNFLFGFEGFRDLLVRLFPSRMLGEEFYMASHMPVWISLVGCISLLGVLVVGCWLLVVGRKTDVASGHVDELQTQASSLQSKAFLISCIAWFLLYAVAVIRTEAGSPELWVLGVIPFWFIFSPLLRGRWAWVLVALLFAHNLVAGLLPVMSEKSDYHVAKGRWLVEHSTKDDLILTSYEPVMIFYLDYFGAARVVNSGDISLKDINALLDDPQGKVYALNSFFQPLESMRVRRLDLYERMEESGQALRGRFVKIQNDEFGGIYSLEGVGEKNE